MLAEAIDVDGLREWIGREETARDEVGARLARSLEATLDREPLGFETGEDAPLAIHWCLAPPMVPLSQTGPDGHPARGGFLPAVPLPRRMWAGGEIRFHDPLRIGDRVTRRSRIDDIAMKEGRSGPLCFVTVRHEYTTERGVSVEERQDIVYREASSSAAKPPAPAEPRRADRSISMQATSLLLFRYSAITFNGHRIHYDADYCREEEGYPGLVVHGPLQATLMMHLAQDFAGVAPAQFSYRGVSPLFGGETFTVNAAESEDGLDLWVARADGQPTMTAEARF